MSACSKQGSCSWRSVALKGLLGALLASVVVVSFRILTHQESHRGTF